MSVLGGTLHTTVRLFPCTPWGLHTRVHTGAHPCAKQPAHPCTSSICTLLPKIKKARNAHISRDFQENAHSCGSRTNLPTTESTSFTSMGSQVRVLLRPPQNLEGIRLSRFFSVSWTSALLPVGGPDRHTISFYQLRSFTNIQNFECAVSFSMLTGWSPISFTRVDVNGSPASM